MTKPWHEEAEWLVKRLSPEDEANSVIAYVLRAALAERESLIDEVQHYRDGITWQTSCLNCADLMNKNYDAFARAEAAESALATEIEASDQARSRGYELQARAEEAEGKIATLREKLARVRDLDDMLRVAEETGVLPKP